jgi:hypothetical protein
MVKKNLILEKWKRHISTSENKNSSNSILMESKKAYNGKTFAVVQENNKFYIKESITKGEAVTVEDFDYIGGLQNKPNEKFDSMSAALRRLNAKVYAINESLDFIPEEDEEDRLFNKLDQKNTEQPAEEPMGEPTPDSGMPMGEPTPDSDMSPPMSDPAGEPPVDTTGDGDFNFGDAQDQPQGDAPIETTPTEDPIDAELSNIEANATGGADQSQDPMGGEAPAEDGQPGMGDEPNMGDESTVDGDTESEGEGENSYNDIMSELGRLGNEIDKVELSPQMVKTILNTLITKTKDGIEKMSDEDKEVLSKRIRKDGRKLEEDEMDFGSEESFEMGSDMSGDSAFGDTSMGGSSLPSVIQEEVTALERVISKLVNESIERKTQR